MFNSKKNNLEMFCFCFGDMNGFRKIFPRFLSHYATSFAKLAKRKLVPFDEFYYQLKLMHLFQKHPVYKGVFLKCAEILPARL
jgi:hypothetical protein